MAKKKKDELMKALSDVLRKNLTTDAGTAILDQIARSMDAGEEEVLTVSVYEKTSEDVVMIDNQNYVGEMDEDDDYEQVDMEAWVTRESY